MVCVNRKPWDMWVRFSFSVAMYGMFYLVGGDNAKLGLGHVRIFLCILENPRGAINFA